MFDAGKDILAGYYEKLRCRLNPSSFSFLSCHFPFFLSPPFFLGGANVPSAPLWISQWCKHNSFNLLNRISWNSVVNKDILCTCAYLQKILLWLFPERTIRTWAKIYHFVQLLWNWFTMNDREAVQSDIFLTVNVKCDNY